MDGLIEGRIVHYVLPTGLTKGEHRSAVVTKVWQTGGEPEGAISLTVFPILGDMPDFPTAYQVDYIHYDENGELNTWHWIEGSQAAKAKAVTTKLDEGAPTDDETTKTKRSR